MYNLYQSHMWKDIQYKVYGKPSMEVSLFGRTYTATIKCKKLPFGLSVQWVQILGVDIPSDKKYVREELAKLKKQFSPWNTMFVQLWLINEIISFDNYLHKSESFEGDMRRMRLSTQNYMEMVYGIRPSFRENMPLSNIIYDVTKTDEELIAEMNKWCKERIKKALKQDIHFASATPEQYDYFYDQWVALSDDKGFTVIPKQDYYDLIKYLRDNNAGQLFIAEKDWELVAGSICMYDTHRITYLYGFANRKFRNIGWHHFLKYKIFGRARNRGITACDMLGGAPTGFPEHSLTGVSAFKESLGGTKVEIYGNYDLVISPILYTLSRRVYTLKKKIFW